MAVIDEVMEIKHNFVFVLKCKAFAACRENSKVLLTFKEML